MKIERRICIAGVCYYVLKVEGKLLIQEHWEVGKDGTDYCSIRYWLWEGKYHRGEGPAVEHFNSKGEKEEEEWYWRGLLHRKGGPAKTYFGTGSFGGEEYYLNGTKMLKSEYQKVGCRICWEFGNGN